MAIKVSDKEMITIRHGANALCVSAPIQIAPPIASAR